MPADILRERAAEAAPAETPSAPTPKPAPFDLGAAYEPLLKRYDAMLETLAKRQESILPKLEAAQTGATAAEQEAGRARLISTLTAEPYLRAAEAPRRPAPEPAPEPPVPSTRGRPFMSVDGQNALQGMVQSLSLMAQMAMAGTAPVAALGALTGAMRGWTAGDQERAETQWREYLGQVEQIRTRNREARALWLDDMSWANANEDRFKARYVVSLAEVGQAERAAAAARMSAKDILDELNKVDSAATSVLGHSATAIKAIADERLRAMMQERLLAQAERTAEHQKTQEALQLKAIEERQKRFDVLLPLREAAAERGERGLQIRERLSQLAPQITKLETQRTGLDARESQLQQLRDAVDLLRSEKLIPEGPTEAEWLLTRGRLQTKIGRQDVSNAVQALNRWGTALLLSSELSTAGAATMFRFKAITEAEAGNVPRIPYSFWQTFFTDSDKVLRERRQQLDRQLRSIDAISRGAQGMPTAGWGVAEESE